METEVEETQVEQEKFKGGLYGKILAVMDKVKTVKKNGEVSFKNTHYNYQKEEDITAAIRDARIEVGLVVIPIKCEVIKNEGSMIQIVMTYRFVDSETGEFIDLQMGGEGQDSGDKKIYKAETGAYKYMQKQAFGLTSEEVDPDNVPSELMNDTPSTPADYLETRFKFGAHTGKTIREVATSNPGYIKWCAGKQGDLQAVCQKAVEELKL